MPGNILNSSLIVILFIIIFSACTSQQGPMRTWQTEEYYEKRFRNLMIMGLVNRVAIRSALENDLVEASHSMGINSTNSMAMFPPELGKPYEDTEKLKQKLREKSFDGILTVAVIDIQEERYIGPSADYQPVTFYDRFGNYYYRTYALVYKEGYFSRNTKYYIEANLYELQKGQLVWSGLSGAFQPSEFEDFNLEFSNRLFKELISTGIVKN